jgi:hypothetical protein
VELLLTGLVRPVLEKFVAWCESRTIDHSLIRYFLVTLLSSIEPPFSTEFVEWVTSVLQRDSVSEAIVKNTAALQPVQAFLGEHARGMLLLLHPSFVSHAQRPFQLIAEIVRQIRRGVWSIWSTNFCACTRSPRVSRVCEAKPQRKPTNPPGHKKQQKKDDDGRLSLLLCGWNGLESTHFEHVLEVLE